MGAFLDVLYISGIYCSVLETNFIIFSQVNALASLQGGSDGGDICRAIMRALMTNYCTGFFSGTGQKGKEAFVGTPVYKIILCK